MLMFIVSIRWQGTTTFNFTSALSLSFIPVQLTETQLTLQNPGNVFTNVSQKQQFSICVNKMDLTKQKFEIVLTSE